MTVIAWDGKTLAGDRQTTHDNTPTLTRKVYRIRHPRGGHVLIGCSGHSGDCQEYIRAALGEITEKPNFSSLLVLLIDQQGKAWGMNERLVWWAIDAPYWSIGSGCDFALGAMHAGKTAREAVLIASKLDKSCGLGVDVVRL